MNEDLKNKANNVVVPRGGRYDDVNGVCESSEDCPTCEEDEMSKLIAARANKDVYSAVRDKDSGILNTGVIRSLQRGIWKG